MEKLIKLNFSNELERNLQTHPQFIQMILGPRSLYHLGELQAVRTKSDEFFGECLFLRPTVLVGF